jgi:hypothetical protein
VVRATGTGPFVTGSATAWAASTSFVKAEPSSAAEAASFVVRAAASWVDPLAVAFPWRTSSPSAGGSKSLEFVRQVEA